jgi:site-specific DNA recombinase
VRVSTPEQAREGESLDAQTKRLSDYVQLRTTPQCKWELTDVYREEGVSAKEGSIQKDRKEFLRLLADIESGRINMVLVTKLDHLTRSVKDFYDIWQDFEDNNVEFYSLEENFDTSTPMGRFALRLIVLFAELEREITSDRVSSTMEFRASKGLWNGSRILGFVADDEGVLQPVEEEIAIVQRMFEKCRELGSAGAVLTDLNENGFRAPKFRTKKGTMRGGGRFCKQTVINILTNPAYIGKIRYKNKIYKGGHEAVIDNNTFNEAKSILEKNREVRRTPKSNDHIYLLKGILRDGKCNHMMTPYSSTGRNALHYYYKCTLRAHKGKEACNTGYVSADAVENLVLNFIKQISMDEAYIAAIVKEANGQSSKAIKKLKSEKISLEKRLLPVRKELQAMARAIAEGGKKFKVLANELERLENERNAMETELTELQTKRKQTEQHSLSAQVLIQTLKDFSQIVENANRKQLQQLLPQIVEVAEWHENQDKPGTGELRVSLFEEFQPDRLLDNDRVLNKKTCSHQVKNGASKCLCWYVKRNEAKKSDNYRNFKGQREILLTIKV